LLEGSISVPPVDPGFLPQSPTPCLDFYSAGAGEAEKTELDIIHAPFLTDLRFALRSLMPGVMCTLGIAEKRPSSASSAACCCGTGLHQITG
jgi:hypothetical protein